jgi:hypothetical protein
MGENCTVFKQLKSGHFVAFKTETGESYTGFQLNKQQSIRHNKTGIIGKTYPTK